MRILILSNFYPPHSLGGMEIRCCETVELLKQRGHDCLVLTSRFGLRGEHQVRDGIIRSLYLQADIDYYKPLDFFLKRPRQEQINEQVLHDTINTFQPDVIFIWGVWLLSRRLAYLAEQLMPGRVAYSVAGYWLAQPDIHESYWRKPGRNCWARILLFPLRYLALRLLAYEKQKYRLTLAQVACVSHYVRDRLHEAGALPHGARVIYNGIDPRPFLDAIAQHTNGYDTKLRLVYTGGLTAKKGVVTTLDALGWLQQQDKLEGLHLTLVGSGHPDYEMYLQQKVAKLGLNEQVTFFGRIPREEIAQVLAEHDVFLFTSIYEEPLARTVMEAMAANLTVIGTAVGGQGEMLKDGVNALLFSPGNHVELAEQILKLQANPELRNHLATAGQCTILEYFTLERMVDEIEDWLLTIGD